MWVLSFRAAPTGPCRFHLAGRNGSDGGLPIGGGGVKGEGEFGIHGSRFCPFGGFPSSQFQVPVPGAGLTPSCVQGSLRTPPITTLEASSWIPSRSPRGNVGTLRPS